MSAVFLVPFQLGPWWTPKSRALEILFFELGTPLPQAALSNEDDQSARPKLNRVPSASPKFIHSIPNHRPHLHFCSHPVTASAFTVTTTHHACTACRNYRQWKSTNPNTPKTCSQPQPSSPQASSDHFWGGCNAHLLPQRFLR